MLHGCQQTATQFAQGTRMNQWAEQMGYAVLYPQQSVSAHAQRCWKWYDRATQEGGGDVPILFLSSRDDEIDRALGIELGADDYVVKPFSPREVVARVMAILRRTSARPPAIEDGRDLEHGRLRLDLDGWRALWGDAEVTLTVTEFSILRLLASMPAKVFSRDAIIDRLHGPGFAITDRTIDSHIRNLRHKFAAIGCADLIDTRPGIGYRLGTCTGG